MIRVIRNPIGILKSGTSRLPIDLLIWLTLVLFILGSMIFFGQLALILLPKDPPADTLSRVFADYRSWVYDTIPPINSKALIADIIKDQKLAEALDPHVVTGIFWPPPTPTVTDLTAGSGTVTPAVTNAVPLQPTFTSVSATAVTQQATQVGPTATRTVTGTLPPSQTPSLRPSATNTSQPIQATAAFTRTVAPTVPPSTPTRTFTPIPPTPVPPTPQKPTPTPVPPTSVPPTAVPVIPTAQIAPVHPIAENDGISTSDAASGGCVISFGYLNDNPQGVDIPIGSLNYLNPNIQPAPQVQHFLVGRMFDTFRVVWTTPGPLTWYLNGQSATAKWCK